MDGLIKNIEELPESLQEAIRRGIRTRIISEADFYKEECETELLAYLDAEIKRADNSMKEMHQESTKVGAELFGISKTYVWNKEKKKALINYKNDYLMQLQANGCKSKQLPKELDNEQARLIFAKAVEAGLMDDNYNWIGTKRLLACFCREMSIKLGLGKGEANRRPMLSWKPFEKLFGINNLRGAFNDIQREGQNPIGIEIIDEIFK